MKLTEKCKEEFSVWLVCGEGIINFEKYYNDRDGSDDPYTWFMELPQSMQYGVYVDFFDSVGVDLRVDKIFFDEHEWFCCIINRVFINTDNGLPINHFNTRQEARTEAITKANEIHNRRN